MKSRRPNLEGEQHHCAEGTSARHPEPIGNPSAPLSLVTHWSKISTPSVVAQISGRLKGKYTPIDISCISTERTILGVRTNSTSKRFREATSPASLHRAGRSSWIFACDFPESINEDFSLEFPRYSEHSQIQHYIPTVTAVFGQPSPRYPRIGHSTPDPSQSASLFPQLRHEKRLLPPPRAALKVNLDLQAGIKFGETRFVGHPHRQHESEFNKFVGVRP